MAESITPKHIEVLRTVIDSAIHGTYQLDGADLGFLLQALNELEALKFPGEDRG